MKTKKFDGAHPVVAASRAALAVRRAFPEVPAWRLLDTLSKALAGEAELLVDGETLWERYVAHAFEQHRLWEALQQLIAGCRRHRGDGLRQARKLRGRAVRLLRACRQEAAGEIDEEAAEELKRLLSAYTQLGASKVGTVASR